MENKLKISALPTGVWLLIGIAGMYVIYQIAKILFPLAVIVAAGTIVWKWHKNFINKKKKGETK